MESKEEKKDFLTGCLLGCAAGDSIGLPFEGLKPGRVKKLIKEPFNQQLVFGKGMVSDDTDHTVFVAQSLYRHSKDVLAFRRCLAWKLRLWLLCLPAGIGLATLKSTVKLWLGFPPDRSGVFSAGNGPAMRSAIIGAYFAEDQERRAAFVQASTELTHTDPKAYWGALAIAELASLSVKQPGQRPSLRVLKEILEAISEDLSWRNLTGQILEACERNDPATALPENARNRGVSGFIYHTLPAVIVAWYLHYGDFAKTIRHLVEMGGDTDTTAAIAGALAGFAQQGQDIPASWLENLWDKPHSVTFLKSLGAGLASAGPCPTSFSPWLAFRNIVFTAIVLTHAFRRLLPPY